MVMNETENGTLSHGGGKTNDAGLRVSRQINLEIGLFRSRVTFSKEFFATPDFGILRDGSSSAPPCTRIDVGVTYVCCYHRFTVQCDYCYRCREIQPGLSKLRTQSKPARMHSRTPLVGIHQPCILPCSPHSDSDAFYRYK